MNFHHCHISEYAKRLVNQCLDSGYVNEGPMVKRLEAELERQFGYQNVVAINSGTSALHLALILAGVQNHGDAERDEVILPAQTFVATGMAVLMAGAKPVFADVGARTGLLELDDVQIKMNERTKAVIAVHWAGTPCNIDGLGCAVHDTGVRIVHDCAHALGTNAIRQEEVAYFSFQSIKHVTGGNGGALVGDFDVERARRLRWFGLDRDTAMPGILGEREGDIDEMAFKYHMVDLNAALALGNLADFKERLARRHHITARYYYALLPDILLQHTLESSCWLFPLLVDRREDFIRAMAGRGVLTNVCHQRIDRYSVFGGRRDDLPGTDYWDSHQINIPCHEGLTDDDVIQVIDAVNKGW